MSTRFNSRLPVRPESAVEAYCFKCKAKREIENPTRVWMKNGKPRIQGSCSVCHARISRLGKG